MDNTSHRKIVFVIGAGASAEFGFPVGSGLAQAIQAQLDHEFGPGADGQGSGPLATTSRQLGLSDDQRLDAINQLRFGIGPGESIDLFLFRRRVSQAVRSLGMVALAHVILDHERRPPLANFKLDDNESSLVATRQTLGSWPAHLLDGIIGQRAGKEITPQLFGDIGFAIFNYDRCVEHALFHILHRRHHLPIDHAREIVQSIPMVHIYGVLGDPWRQAVPFGAENAPLSTIVTGLRTYHEELGDSVHEQRIREMMDHAAKLVFLGFGFHPNNVDLLYPTGTHPPTAVFGTTMGVNPGSSQVKRISPGGHALWQPVGCAEFISSARSRILA
jgi:hypothetical protein